MKIECNHCGYTYSNELAMNFDPNDCAVSFLVGSKRSREILQCEKFIRHEDIIICPICNSTQDFDNKIN